jgi:hypothetical protein
MNDTTFQKTKWWDSFDYGKYLLYLEHKFKNQ